MTPPIPPNPQTGPRVDRISILALSIILVTYFAIGALYAVNTPAWQVPDEPAHYNYIRHIAQTGTLPVLQVGDYDQNYLEQLKSQRFPPDLSIGSVKYEAWQPPLYYVLAAPVFLLFGGALLPLRLFSLTLGAGVMVFTFLAAREISTHPRVNLLALAAAGFVAFIPQHIAMMAGVDNDSLSELLIAIGLWLILRELPMRRGGWALGVVIGLAVVTKSHAYVLIPVTAFMLFLTWRRGRLGDWQLAVGRLAALFGPALILGALLWGRNIALYGWPDFMASNWHSFVVKGQPRTSEWLALYGAAGLVQRFVVTTFQSFWGQFGWMGVVMDRRVYLALLLFSAGLAFGATAAAVRHYRDLIPFERDGAKILLVSAFFSVALYLYYNLSFVQHQGRYLFPALIPLGLAAAAGLWQWAHWIGRGIRLKAQSSRETAEAMLMLAPLALMAFLDVFALYRFIIPALTLHA
jgi:4-amino-4-deoxy-L-arabinose transferase-like glycosyltransferase